MTSSKVNQSLNKFRCQRCHACCKQSGFVYLKLNEADLIADFMNMNIYDFTDEYCELQDRQKLVLKKHEDEACIFLTDSGCAVYEVRPQQCRDFPVKWRTPKSYDYCVGMR